MTVATPAPGPGRKQLAEELRARGLPLVLGPRARADGLIRRSAPLLCALAYFLANVDVSATRLASLDEAEIVALPSRDAVVIGTAVLLASAAPLVWWLAALALRRVTPRVQVVVGTVALVALGVLPFLTSTGEGPSLLETAMLVAVVLFATYVGLGAMLAWAGRRAVREMGRLGSMIGRVLPVLTLTLLFSFYNAEIWQVAAQLSLLRTWGAVAAIASLGLALAVLNARDEVGRILREHDDDPRWHSDLSRIEKANVVAVVVLINLIQVSILAVIVFAFYVCFGVLSITPTTASQWIGSMPERFDGVWAQVPVSRPLVQVCLILASFSALSFLASSGADPIYRATFVEPALDEVREGLVVRNRYREFDTAPLEADGTPTKDETHAE